MPDNRKILQVPLIPGVRQDLDRTLLPAGSLIAAAQTRVRKGGIAKALAFSSAGTTMVTGNFGGAIEALGFSAGRQVVVSDGRAMVRANTGDAWKECGRASRFLPVKTHWIAFDEAASDFNRYSCAAVGDRIALCYTRTTGNTHVPTAMVLDMPSGTVRWRAEGIAAQKVAVVAVGSEFCFVYENSVANGDLMLRKLPASATSWTAAGEVQIGTAAELLASGEPFDVATYNTTAFLLAWRVGATEVSTSLVLAADGSIPAFRGATCANTALASITTFGTAGEPIWTAFDEGGANGRKLVNFSANLASTVAGPTAYADGGGAGGGYGRKTGFCRKSSSQAYMAYNVQTNTSGTNTFRLEFGHATGATYTTLRAFQHGVLASAPFAPVDTASQDSAALWFTTDNGSPGLSAPDGAWVTQRKYWLSTAVTGNTGGAHEIELGPDERASILVGGFSPVPCQRTHTDAFGDTSTRYYSLALAVLRTADASGEGGIETDRTAESSALVMYEVEAADGYSSRTRQALEVGGRTLIVGGHVQEVYAGRDMSPNDFVGGVENGYAFAPAILKVTATSGAGLTADADYSFCATYSYVSPSGEITRSAPSNIVPLTPTGNTCQATFQISVGPFTEREFTTPPNKSVIHLWATVGGGNTFQRVTPDNEGAAAIPTSTATALIEYVHSMADAETATREALYTDLGPLKNEPSPAHRFGWVGGGRLVLAGMFDPTIIEMAKVPRANEAVAFTRDPRFRTQLPEAVTAGAFLDNAHVIWTATGAYLLPSLGPDDSGAPSLPTPSRLPSTVGCLDWRSVVEVPEGVIFQSKRGVELMPRGFGMPRILSQAVQDTLRTRRVISATVTNLAGPGERLLILMAKGSGESGARLVYDLDLDRWISVDAVSNSFGEHLTNWDGKLTVGDRAAGTLLQEATNTWTTNSWSFTTSDIRPFEMGRGQVHRIQLLGEFKTTCNVSLVGYVDGEVSKPLVLGTRTVDGIAGDKFILEWPMKFLPGSADQRESRITSLALEVGVTGANTNTECAILHAFGLEVTALPGRHRLRQNRTGGT